MNSPSSLKLLPGTRRLAALEVLTKVKSELGNTQAAGRTVRENYLAYIEWVNESARILRSYLDSGEIDRLILTRRYWVLQSTPVESIDPRGRMLGLEVYERGITLDAEIAQLRTTILEHWGGWERYVIADTSVFCQHPQKLEELNLSEVLHSDKFATEENQPIHLIMPIAVVDELDKLKEAGKSQTRWRARYTLAVLDRVLGDGLKGTLHDAGQFQTESGKPSPQVTVEVVLDPPGHIRQPITDDEILDRAQAIRSLADRDIWFITFDTGQSTRARRTDLRVRKLREPYDDREPPKT